jgi:hypothetical protein
MRFLHVKVEQDEGWLIAQALEEPGIITEGRNFDELMFNIRDAAELFLQEKDIHIELLVPANVKIPAAKKARKSRKRAA